MRSRQVRSVKAAATRPKALLGRVAGALRRRVYWYIPRRLRAFTQRGLLSVVVPAYNVEAYLAETLDSLRAQTYLDIEIIVIVDGATDGTYAIANLYETRDKRIRVYWQKNAGLSAARNAGAGHARGEFLWFLDSDDTAESKAAALAIASLRTTGSDFAVLCYRRFNSTRRWNAMLWVREAHQHARLGVSLREYPDILVNAVAWSKVYRRSFYMRQGLSFAVGALYEDQQVSARAYALAQKIDILPQVLLNWRDREDGTSISQHGSELHDLRGRLDAAQASLAELRHAGGRDLVTVRAAQLLANDLPHSMKFLPAAEPEFWDQLAEGMTELAAGLPLERWREIPAHHAALQWLLCHGDMARAREYVARGGQDAAQLTTARRGNNIVLQVPFWDDPAVGFPTEVLTLSPRQRRLTVVLTAARWTRPGVLELAGFAAPSQMALTETDGPVTAKLVSIDPAPHTIPLELESVVIPDADRYATHQRHDYAGCGFRTVIDVDECGVRPGARYTMVFTITAAGQQDCTALSRIELADPAASLNANTAEHTSPQGVSVRFTRVDVLRMGLRVDHGTAPHSKGDQ